MTSTAGGARTGKTEGDGDARKGSATGRQGVQWEWETYGAHEIATWGEPPIGRDALREMQKDVTLVWRRAKAGAKREKWVIVAESAALRGTPAKGEYGLYAWRDFKRDERIGEYKGTVLGPSIARQLRAHLHADCRGGRGMPARHWRGFDRGPRSSTIELQGCFPPPPPIAFVTLVPKARG